MALLKNPFAKMDKRKAKKILNDKAQKIVNKALNVTIVDLYHLALIKKTRDKLERDGGDE